MFIMKSVKRIIWEEVDRLPYQIINQLYPTANAVDEQVGKVLWDRVRHQVEHSIMWCIREST